MVNYKFDSVLDSLDKADLDLVNEIKNSIIKMKMRTQPYYYKGKSIIAKKQIYRLGIPKSHVKEWKKLIGLHLRHSKKSAVVLEI